ncbi:MAG: excinuclease ABC subunit UvrA [Bdellovibrionales bacterium]|nr:excinuclease ABC subunit UvrA [Bdellovibrionales bacterium]
MTVITGLSGSGKSSLAFDTIYAEGQRRYIESLSAYARNFLDQLKKPEVDSIAGLSPSIAIDQKSISTNPRSTVGTVTEIYDFLRLLFARIGTPNCPVHKVPVSSRTPQDIVDEVMNLPEGTKFYVLAPVAINKKGEFFAEFQKWLKKGFTQARIDGQWMELADAEKLAKHKAHTIDLMVDRLVIQEKFRSRLAESLNLALSLTDGLVTIEVMDQPQQIYSIHRACPQCGFSFPEMEPRLFSFNNPRGACPTCNGMGSLDFEEIVRETGYGDQAQTTTHWRWRGEKVDTKGDEMDEGVDEYALDTCPDCHGERLRKEALNVFVGDKTITEMSRMPASDLLKLLNGLKLQRREQLIGEKIIQQICDRLEYMVRVGTPYLSLERPTRTLSGGEVQRIRLATQMGSSLVGVLYVLDEPSIGLHPRDHHRLLGILQEIRNRGNTILLVEHDEETIRSADHIIDIGPRAGREGGEVIACGTPDEISKHPQSLTGGYLSGRLTVGQPEKLREGNGQWIELKGATGHNLQSVHLKLPLGKFIGVTGVSGSGKSTLIGDTLYRIIAKEFYGSSRKPAPYESIAGLDQIDKVIEINQKPIGRTPRSIPATYVGAYSPIRDLFAQLPEARLRGYRPGHFSFNVKGGRCETCQGAGLVKVEMHFLSDVYVTCETCHGARFTAETLNLKFKDKSIADVLNMTVGEAKDFFKNHRTIFNKLDTLEKVGLDYLTLGQSSTTLSGGEAQRVKLSKELSKRGTGKTLYILDEPTTGLHFDDVKKLIELLHGLVDQGNSVLVIEHNLDVLKNCDYLVELGPEGGSEGGEIIFQGPTRELLKHKSSPTAPYLLPLLQPR